jgi:hypothetical protein
MLPLCVSTVGLIPADVSHKKNKIGTGDKDVCGWATSRRTMSVGGKQQNKTDFQGSQALLLPYDKPWAAEAAKRTARAANSVSISTCKSEKYGDGAYNLQQDMMSVNKLSE